MAATPRGAAEASAELAETADLRRPATLRLAGASVMHYVPFLLMIEASLSVTPASRVCSQISMPGTFVAMGIATNWQGASTMSWCGGPPDRIMMIVFW
jgi:hypothetical protein